ncbi:MAG: YgiQ family radical SAM protein [Candidatus Marinimicrobia bacterium]|nr:YgiQ family radical SAM protein [Candidatus Neomarinimicrobiota bacterium]
MRKELNWWTAGTAPGTASRIERIPEGISRTASIDDNMIFPTSKKEMQALGWRQCDVIIVSGDAYADHPSFGTAVIARVLESEGYKVGILDQPDWKDDADIRRLGEPRLCFAVTAGNIDSMVAHYTVNRKKRHDDAYTPGGMAGKRPNRASIVYTNLLQSTFRGVPVILGGVEASLRRMAHYDYWNDKVRRSILLDSKADLLIYGMAEKPVKEVLRRLAEGEAVRKIRDVPGTVCREDTVGDGGIELPAFQKVSVDKKAFNTMTRLQYENRIHPYAKPLYQQHGRQIIRINPPPEPMSTEEMDAVYDLPFTREPHPKYREKIPAWEQIKSSVTAHRGCFGNCAFCAITFHQGPRIQSRSHDSVLKEVREMSKRSWFRGTVSDIGGPTANMYGIRCAIGGCKTMHCIYPEICKHLRVTDQEKYVKLLEDAAKLPGVKHVFIASGLRHDLALADLPAMEKMVSEFTGGHLKIAPEHLAGEVTRVMNKPGGKVYFDFLEKFREFSEKAGKEQYIVPYFISGHPGCTDAMMRELQKSLKQSNHRLQQAADFYPTPMTLATAMYHTGFHPLTGEKLHVPKSDREKRRQFSMMMWHKKPERK